LEDAAREYGHALSINPRLTPAYTNRSAIHAARGNLDAAEADLRKAIELSPGSAAPYINLAAIALRRNRPEDALALLGQLQGTDHASLAHFTRAEALFRLGCYDDARREYGRSLALAGWIGRIGCRLSGFSLQVGS
jgi:tetratricopeptide (TPR) repeat protein